MTKKEDKEEQLDIENVAEDLESANGIDSEEKNSSDITEKDEQKPEDKIKELEDQLLRAKAEVQNVRRIAAQEVTRARLYGIESLAKEFLAVGDNIERAISKSETNKNLNYNSLVYEGFGPEKIAIFQLLKMMI